MARTTALDIMSYVRELQKDKRRDREREQEVALSLLQLSSQIEEKRKDRELQYATIRNQAASSAAKLAADASIAGAIVPEYTGLMEIDKTSGGESFMNATIEGLEADAKWQAEVSNNMAHAQRGNQFAVQIDGLSSDRDFIVTPEEVDAFIKAQDEKTDGAFSKSMSGPGDKESFINGALLSSKELNNLLAIKETLDQMDARDKQKSLTEKREEKIDVSIEASKKDKLTASDKIAYRSAMTDALKQMKLNFAMDDKGKWGIATDKPVNLGGVESTLSQFMSLGTPTSQFIKDNISHVTGGIPDGESFYDALYSDPNSEQIIEELEYIWPGSMLTIIQRGDQLLNDSLIDRNIPTESDTPSFDERDMEGLW